VIAGQEWLGFGGDKKKGGQQLTIGDKMLYGLNRRVSNGCTICQGFFRGFLTYHHRESLDAKTGFGIEDD